MSDLIEQAKHYRKQNAGFATPIINELIIRIEELESNNGSLQAKNKRLRETLERIGGAGNIGDNPNGLWSGADELEVVKYVAQEVLRNE